MDLNATQLLADFGGMLPEIALALLFIVALVVDASARGTGRRAVLFVVLAGAVVAGGLLVTQGMLIAGGTAAKGDARFFEDVFHAEWLFKGSNQPYGFGMVVVDGFAIFFKALIVLALVLALCHALAARDLAGEGVERPGRFGALLAVAALGMFLMAGANDLLPMYAAVELFSLAAYALSGSARRPPRSAEAAVKYVLYGGVASAVMLCGISLMYGLLGTTNFAELGLLLGAPNTENALRNPLVISSVMIFAGLAFKIAAAPFHFWAPDVCEGTPAPAAAFLAAAGKAAGFAVMARFILVAYPTAMQGFDWRPVLGGVAVLTMSLGNLAALQQTNLKRLLACLSIAFGGNVLVGLAVATPAGVAAILVSFAFYVPAIIGAFFMVSKLAEHAGSEELEDMRGAGAAAPFATFCFAVCIVALAGLPPTSGFIGRLFLFNAAIDAGGRFIWLGLAAGVNAVVALCAVLRILKALYFDRTECEPGGWTFGLAGRIMMGVLALAVLAFGIPGVFNPVLALAEESLRGLLPYLHDTVSNAGL
ncbi:MAG TPA: NADH-quinone oxidoreductase subunit N [Candidatus Kapabacteria bacterium]|nr:NADH-quinone oxidoreductase subunit N [Candidatus Kapabacteria bacterium]